MIPLAGLLLLLTARPANAYITSAVMEVMADDMAEIYLNEKVILKKEDCDVIFAAYMCLSTSDGTLPIEFFLNNRDNLLGVACYDKSGGKSQISYRLTVNHSRGDPVVVWGELEKTRHKQYLPTPGKGVKLPENWYGFQFDDTTWGMPVLRIPQDYFSPTIDPNVFSLPDRHFSSMMKDGYIPVLSATAPGDAIPGEVNLYRSWFKFPNDVAKAKLTMNPTASNAGQNVAFRVGPGPDATFLSDYRLFAILPPGLKPLKISDQGVYDQAQNMVSWDYRGIAGTSEYLSLPAEKVLKSSSGWKETELALGPFKDILIAKKYGIPGRLRSKVAKFLPGHDAWFKTQASQFTDSPDSPVIQGVIIKAQAMPGGGDLPGRKSADHIYMNYTVDGSMDHFVLKKDVQLDKAVSNWHWGVAYHDASEDRKWTWNDINNLKFKIYAKQVATRDEAQMGSLVVHVRSVRLEKLSPSFYAQVLEPKCTVLPVKAGVVEPRSKSMGVDTFELPVNQRLCIPTATRTCTPVPPPGPTPVPTPTFTPIILPASAFGLADMKSSPEPFSMGGVFISFSLKIPASVRVEIYDQSNRPVRRIPAVDCRAGSNQFFFNALDDQENPLMPGQYTYRLVASTDKGAAQADAKFTRAQDRRGRK